MSGADPPYARKESLRRIGGPKVSLRQFAGRRAADPTSEKGTEDSHDRNLFESERITIPRMRYFEEDGRLRMEQRG